MPADVRATIPAEPVRFWVGPILPDGEKRSGLYAEYRSPEERPGPVDRRFTLAADGKVSQTVLGDHAGLVGNLPGTVSEKDFFLPETSSIRGGEIVIPVQFVRYTGPILDQPAPCAVYVTADLPPLAAGKYCARIVFTDYKYTGDRTKITRAPAGRPPSFAPLTCTFEVRAGEDTAAAEDIAWGEAQNGLRARLVVENPALAGAGFFKAHLELQNVGKEPLSVLDRASFAWTVRVIDPEGGEVRPRFVRSEVFSMPRRVRLKPGESAQVSVAEERATDVEVPGEGNVGLLDTTNRIWHLPVGRYRVSAVYSSRFWGKRGKPADMWSGEISAPAVGIEVRAAQRAAAAEDIAWGEAQNGLRLGLAPTRVELGAGEMSMRVRVSYENVGDAPREVPVHNAPHVNAYRLMFAGEKGGKPFHACALAFMRRHETISPGHKTLKPGERFSEEIAPEFPTGGLWRDGFVIPVTFKPGESLTLRTGLCAALDPSGAKEWNAADTLRSGAITVARAAR